MSIVATSPDRLEAARRNASVPASPKFLIERILTYAALIIAVLLVLFPIYWMVITSLKLPREIYRLPALWPHVVTFQQL